MKYIESSECYAIIYEALMTYGNEKQLDMVVEESVELIVSINKLKRNGILREKKNVLTEIADVYVMLEQLKLIADVSEVELENEIYSKVNRLKDRLRSIKTYTK
jgi:NTP pyrophosphatase (non-canonical NTP hydrolase)